MAYENTGLPILMRIALATIGAGIVTLALWLGTELVFGGALIVGAIAAAFGFLFSGIAGGTDPVYRYKGGRLPAPLYVPEAEDGANVEAAAPVAPAPEPEPEPAPEAAPEPAPAAAETPAPEPAPAAAETPAPEPVAAAATEAAPAEAESPGVKPSLLTEARDGGADDLKQIKGVGPKLEGLLHSLGVFHFDQIAAWSADEVAWVDVNLEGFKGRVTRDGWVEQAKILASGGETEFSKKVEEGDVY